MPQFTVGGKTYILDYKDVVKAMQNEVPEPIREYYVEIGKYQFPPKQIIAKVLKLQRVAFTTMDAYRILNKLGFDIKN